MSWAARTLISRILPFLHPEDNPNTDGIHIVRSSQINIIDSNIGTGDDFISIGDGTEQLSNTKVTCGPGHGISVGSLGKNRDEAPVTAIKVKNSTSSGTTNGVRIKTWPASNAGGSASDTHFGDIVMNAFSNPILTDQLYCSWNQCNTKLQSLVKISNFSFKNILGISACPVAVMAYRARVWRLQTLTLPSQEMKHLKLCPSAVMFGPDFPENRTRQPAAAPLPYCFR